MSDSQLASPIWPEHLEGLERIGQGDTAEVFRVRLPGGAEALLKLGHDASRAATLAHEARAHVASVGAIATPLGVGWLELDGAAAFGVARGLGRPGLLSTAPSGNQLDLANTPDPARLGHALASSLAALHDAGIAHGDVKPANVVITESGATLIDLGLSAPLEQRTPQGATPRYLALGDRDLGDGRARDVLALGLLLAEVLDGSLRREARPLEHARTRTFAGIWAELLPPLLASTPEARPSAAWVADRLRAEPEPRGSAHELRRARARYHRARGSTLARPGHLPGDAHPWLAALLEWGTAIAELAPASAAATAVEPLGARALSALIVDVVGVSALSWPLATLTAAGERAVLTAFERSLTRVPAHALTLAMFSSALTDSGRVELAEPRARGADRVNDAALLAAALLRAPVSEQALAQVEGDVSWPSSIVVEAIGALRLRGELGRALALVPRVSTLPDALTLAACAETLRRAGQREAARSMAERAIALAPEHPPARARACLARLALDEGSAERALELTGSADSPATCEVGALALIALGRHAEADGVLEQAAALPADAEERARLLGARGFGWAAVNAERARIAFSEAALQARQASALVEEASYLTGLGAAAADLGHLEEAISASLRAELLWRHLGRPLLGARALLNAAAAHATAGDRAEATRLASDAEHAARVGGDDRALGYAHLLQADTSDEDARGHALAARHALAAHPEDELRWAARCLAWDDLEHDAVTRLDRAATAPSAAATTAALEWWTARLNDARSSSDQTVEQGVSCVLRAIEVAAPLTVRGRAFAAALLRARERGLSEAALRLTRALAREAELLERRAGRFASSLDRVSWVRDAGRLGRAAEDPPGQTEQLEKLVRSLSSRTDLKDLLRGVVDALVTWTGVERGLLLLRAPDGRLVPRVGRNLGQQDLTADQRALSMSLAERALGALEPVVAVDAAGELPDQIASVHALRLRSVLAVPLVTGGEALGVVYLDDRVRRGAFGPRELAWVRTVATLAAAMVQRALWQARLKRLSRRAERERRALAQALEDRDARLELVERTLSQQKGAHKSAAFASLIGESEAIARALAIAERAAHTALPVLLLGESGTGKELFARAIHAAGARAPRPFVSENVSAIPDTLLESTLFGHVRGAFTGADRTRLGLFESADRGTLFLDEIGEMRPPMQTKLLRILEDGEVHPLGSDRGHKVDVRLIAATHRDLPKMVQAREFREDLFYRLSVLTLRVPSLRERPGDVSLLVAHFLGKHAPGGKARVTRAAMQKLEAAPWPGNVRQLENEIRRALVLSDGVIDVEHLSLGEPGAAEDGQLGLDVKKRIDALEVTLVREALSRTRGNQTQAAKLLGLSRFGLQKMMTRLSIQR